MVYSLPPVFELGQRLVSSPPLCPKSLEACLACSRWSKIMLNEWLHTFPGSYLLPGDFGAFLTPNRLFTKMFWQLSLFSHWVVFDSVWPHGALEFNMWAKLNVTINSLLVSSPLPTKKKHSFYHLWVLFCLYFSPQFSQMIISFPLSRAEYGHATGKLSDLGQTV